MGEVEKEIEGGLKIKIDLKGGNALVIESPKAAGTVLIPRFVVHENHNYKIISIKAKAFENNTIEFLTFPEDSEIESFDENCFYYSHIKKLRIPSKLKNLKEGWSNAIYDLTEIEISPKNTLFVYFNNEFLLGKSQPDKNEFDVLHFSRLDIENAIIPSQVRIIKKCSFYRHENLKTVTFSEKSELKIIENNAFQSSTIEKLYLPSSVEKISDYCFMSVRQLREIEVSPDNKYFTIYDNKYLLKESCFGSKNFDYLVFAFRDIETANIPSQIKTIGICAFQYCKQLKSITFEQNSSVDLIEFFAFASILGPEKIVLPSSVKKINDYSFQFISNLQTIELLSKSIRIGYHSFASITNLSLISFPNADQIVIDSLAMSDIPKEAKILVRKGAKITGKGYEEYKSQISYIETESESLDSPKISSTVERKSGDQSDEKEKEREKLVEENSALKKFVSYLSDHLKKYEDTITFETFKKNMNKYTNENTELGEIERNESETIRIIDPTEEKDRYRVINKIGEGSTSEVFKVFDEEKGIEVCKKVIKETSDETRMKTLRNTLKEIDFMSRVKHPCICDSYGFNLQ